jgi:hypothetical protein
MIFGGGVVYVGTMVAPKNQKIVALCLLLVMGMGGGIALLYQLSHFILNDFLEDIITLAAAAWVTYYIFSQET